MNKTVLILFFLLFCSNGIIISENIMKKYELIQLPYATNALEPVIGKQTIEIHHGKHLLAYVNNLNN